MPNTKNILFIIDSYPPEIGGISTVFSHYVKNAQTYYNKVYILTRNRKQIQPIYCEQKENVELMSFNGSKRFFLKQLWIQGAKICKTKQIHTIHTTTVISAPVGLLLGRKYKIPTLLTVHELFNEQRREYYGWKGIFFHWREWLIFRLPCSLYHCVSYTTESRLTKHYPHLATKTQVIHNGNETQHKPKELSIEKNSQAIHFLYAGHTGKSKGTELILKSIEMLSKKNDRKGHFHFNILTDKNTDSFLKKLHTLESKINKNNITITTSFDLAQEEFLTLLDSADCCVIPSYSEGFSIVAAQASQIKKAIICSDIPVFHEISSGEVYFFEKGNAHKLTECLYTLKINDKKKEEKKAKYHFSREESGKKMLDIYKSLGE